MATHSPTWQHCTNEYDSLPQIKREADRVAYDHAEATMALKSQEPIRHELSVASFRGRAALHRFEGEADIVAAFITHGQPMLAFQLSGWQTVGIHTEVAVVETAPLSQTKIAFDPVLV